MTKVLPLIVGAVIGAIVTALSAATLWRQAQFAAFLNLDWKGIIAICVGQLALLVIPAVWGYAQFRSPSWYTPPALVGGCIANLLVGVASATVQFGPPTPSAVVNAGVPGFTFAAIAAATFLASNYDPALRRVRL